MRLQNPFAALDTAGIDSQVLTVLARTEQDLTATQIHNLLPGEGSLAGVRLSIGRLVIHGTVLERSIGRALAFGLNRDHLLAAPILAIAAAKQELSNRIREQVERWEVLPHTVVLFGSAARNEMTETSDIDLLIVMPETITFEHAIALADDLAAHIHRWTGNDARPLLFLRSELSNAQIFHSILRDGIEIIGQAGWLRSELRALRIVA